MDIQHACLPVSGRILFIYKFAFLMLLVSDSFSSKINVGDTEDALDFMRSDRALCVKNSPVNKSCQDVCGHLRKKKGRCNKVCSLD